MRKVDVDNILGEGILEKSTKKYIQYRYMEKQKLGNVTTSMSWNLRNGRSYHHYRKSYLSIKYSVDNQDVIEIINKL